MSIPGSRYEKTETYLMTTRDGLVVKALRLRLPSSRRLVGFHLRKQGQRLDHLAAKYLADATRFWELCDANGTIVPDGLAVHEHIGIPTKD